MNKENSRAYIKVRIALNFEPKVIHDELHSVFGDQAPLYPTVAECYYDYFSSVSYEKKIR